MLGTLMLVLFLCLFATVPIALSLGISTLGVFATQFPSMPMANNLAQAMITSADSFPLMAIPFFMLVGTLMEKTGIARRLVDIASILTGDTPGGLGMAAIVASMFFAAISGSSPATTAAIGGIMTPEMQKNGYDEDFSLATAAAAGTLGQIIPPSVGMVSYAVLAEVSVGTLFLTGFGPGILMAIFMLIYAYIYVKKNPNIKMNGQKVTAKEAATVFLQSIWALVMPVIILGGIYSGIFTPTESGAIASVYGLICGRYIYKTLEWKNLPKILVNTAVGAGTIMLILGSVQTFSVVLTRGHIPQILSEALLSVTTNKYILLLMFNILLLIAGMFLNAVSAIALFTPILLPIMTSVGVNPYLMGIVMIVNLGIGMITPPVGNCLYVACGMSKRLSFEQISKACIPYIVMLMIALLLITYVEPISMGLIWLTGASAI